MEDTAPHYPIEIYDVLRKRFIRARWLATWDSFPDRPFRIVGKPVTFSGGGTAGHVQRGPK